MAQRVKRPPEMRETRVRSLGREDPLVKEMATHSSVLAWRITWTEQPGRLLKSARNSFSDCGEIARSQGGLSQALSPNPLTVSHPVRTPC